MPARERPLDPLLAVRQPVHRPKQLRLGDLAERELVGERGLREATGHRQLRTRCDHQLADHRHRQVPLTTALPREQPLQIQLAQHPQHRRDVPVRQRPLDLKRLLEVDQHPALKHLADRLDHLDREVREVAKILVLDLAALPVGTAQQIGRVLLPALTLRLDCGYVSLTSTARHYRHNNRTTGRNQGQTLATSNRKKKARPPSTRAIGPQTVKNFRLVVRARWW